MAAPGIVPAAAVEGREGPCPPPVVRTLQNRRLITEVSDCNDRVLSQLDDRGNLIANLSPTCALPQVLQVAVV